MTKERMTLQVLSLAGLVACVILALWGWRTGVLTSQEQMQALVHSCGAVGIVLFILFQAVQVLVASASGSREILSSHKVHITADALAEEVDYSDVDLVVLPGGIPGTPNLAANKTVTDTCIAFAKAGKKVAAICAAPSVLAALGLLEGKNATAHAAFQDKLAGAHVLDTEVVVDGNITTSYGLGGAIPFALELVRQLAGEVEADRIRSAIAYRH